MIDIRSNLACKYYAKPLISVRPNSGTPFAVGSVAGNSDRFSNGPTQSRREAIIMTKNTKIKVIKRNEAAQPVVQPKAEKVEKRHAAREMVSTVKNWVSDFQARKRGETKTAIEQLLAVRPQPSEL
jgi:hypothetical protein